MDRSLVLGTLRMARNRKYQSVAVRWGPPLRAFLLCVLLGGAGVGYVWQKNQIYLLGRQIKDRELQLQKLQEQNEAARQLLLTLRSPRNLEARIRELGLPLTAPHPSQVWLVAEPGAEIPGVARATTWTAQATADADPLP